MGKFMKEAISKWIEAHLQEWFDSDNRKIFQEFCKEMSLNKDFKLDFINIIFYTIEKNKGNVKGYKEGPTISITFPPENKVADNVEIKTDINKEEDYSQIYR
jgi:hypothetical protein